MSLFNRKHKIASDSQTLEQQLSNLVTQSRVTAAALKDALMAEVAERAQEIQDYYSVINVIRSEVADREAKHAAAHTIHSALAVFDTEPVQSPTPFYVEPTVIVSEDQGFPPSATENVTTDEGEVFP